MAKKLLFAVPDAAGALWQPKGHLCAVLCESNKETCVCVVDRFGATATDINVGGADVVHFSWDAAGDLLTVVTSAQDGAKVFVWNSATNGLRSQLLSLERPSFALWSRTRARLAIGSESGALAFYDVAKGLEVAAEDMGFAQISAGAWSNAEILALGSVDGGLTIWDANGKLLKEEKLRSEPSEIRFSNACFTYEGGAPQGTREEKTMSALLGRETLLLLDIDQVLERKPKARSGVAKYSEPVELVFQEVYGAPMTHTWYGDGKIAIGFSEGQVVVVSTQDVLGQELYSLHLCDEFGLVSSAFRMSGRPSWFAFASRREGAEESEEVPDLLLSLSFSEETRLLAVASVHGIVVIDTQTGFECVESFAFSKGPGMGEPDAPAEAVSLRWSPEGDAVYAAKVGTTIRCGCV